MNRFLEQSFVFLFFSVSTSAACAQSFCSINEKTIFSCPIAGAVVSVCSSKNLSRDSGYVQYKFGNLGQVPELIFPKQKLPPGGSFSYGETEAAKWSVKNLQFSSSGSSYTIYSQLSEYGANGAGVVVKNRNGLSTRLSCDTLVSENKFYLLNEIGLRNLPPESLLTAENMVAEWPADSPNVDLLNGVRLHNIAQIESALKMGADVNFHPVGALGVIAAIADGKSAAISSNRSEEFDTESDQILSLLLSKGASSNLSMPNGATAIDLLANKVPDRTILKLMDAGWPTDYSYKLYVGLVIGDPELVKKSLEHGVNPNGSIRGDSYLSIALSRPCVLSEKGDEAEQDKSLAGLKLLLKAGAKLKPESPMGDGDINSIFSWYGNKPNIMPLLDLLIDFATEEDKKNSMAFLKINGQNQSSQSNPNLDLLIKRLSQ